MQEQEVRWKLWKRREILAELEHKEEKNHLQNERISPELGNIE